MKFKHMLLWCYPSKIFTSKIPVLEHFHVFQPFFLTQKIDIFIAKHKIRERRAAIRDKLNIISTAILLGHEQITDRK